MGECLFVMLSHLNYLALKILIPMKNYQSMISFCWRDWNSRLIRLLGVLRSQVCGDSTKNINHGLSQAPSSGESVSGIAYFFTGSQCTQSPIQRYSKKGNVLVNIELQISLDQIYLTYNQWTPLFFKSVYIYNTNWPTQLRLRLNSASKICV